MTLTVRLETIAPGQGLFRIGGVETRAGTLELAIQRNLDDRYLGAGGVWQATPHWHSMPEVATDGGELRVPVGPEIVDAIAGASNMALRILVRGDGDEASAILRVKGHLLGSPAARALARSEARLAPSPEPDLELALDLELLGEPGAPAPERAESGRGSRTLPAGLLFLVLIGAAGIGVWQLGWLDEWLRPEAPETPQDTLAHGVAGQGVSESDPTSETQQQAPAESVRTKPTQGVTEAQHPGGAPEPEALRGIALARTFLADKPHAAAIHAEAKTQEQAGDCDAAMVLYNRAAQSDPKLASSLARRFDPQGFGARGCIESPDATAASLWYRAAAEAGDTAAQRRLGAMLIERETSGPLFEDGIRWLRRAAQGGDRESKDILAKLGQL